MSLEYEPSSGPPHISHACLARGWLVKDASRCRAIWITTKQVGPVSSLDVRHSSSEILKTICYTSTLNPTTCEDRVWDRPASGKKGPNDRNWLEAGPSRTRSSHNPPFLSRTESSGESKHRPLAPPPLDVSYHDPAAERSASDPGHR
jgi:hypothetical protein